MNRFQISHACSILLSTMLFPISIAIIKTSIDGNFSGTSFVFAGTPFLMYLVGPIFLIIGPLIGIFVHSKIHQLSLKVVVYVIVGFILGCLFYLVFVNDGGKIYKGI